MAKLFARGRTTSDSGLGRRPGGTRRTLGLLVAAMLALAFAGVAGAAPAFADPVATHTTLSFDPPGGSKANDVFYQVITITSDNGYVPAGHVDLVSGTECGTSGENLQVQVPVEAGRTEPLRVSISSAGGTLREEACFYPDDSTAYSKSSSGYQEYVVTKKNTSVSLVITPTGSAPVGQEVTFTMTVGVESGYVPPGHVSLLSEGDCATGTPFFTGDVSKDQSDPITDTTTFTPADTYHFDACFFPDRTDIWNPSESGYQDYTITPPPATSPTISGTPPAADVNQPYSFTFDTTGTPAPDVTKLSGTLPPGLDLNSSTGQLTGRPTRAGTYHFTVQATNSASSATDVVTMTVRSLPTIRVTGSNVTEGNNGTRPLTFHVTLSRASAQPVTVQYATANSSATGGQDFVSKSGTLTFSPGQTTKTITVLVKGDRVRESNEVFYLLLHAPSHATLATSSAGGGILNDD